ncbi:MAG TPA: 3-deoxy-7-phosphoheptulonate synthase [Candidatus Caccosoma faecigallinarum]|uniref:3-deoxy-7-phosphoheptulonate synthase n=1 Tax=Candidatus Caccosoma faecigallinarum TaxID=2840720 RepID=A0A9D1G833_9FIRM|nr:3-deoxy-7-phosphoheptulonate synthase [Candidatus Caccosoma faecigallinarum]
MIIVVDKKEQVANIENYLNTFHIHFYTSHQKTCSIIETLTDTFPFDEKNLYAFEGVLSIHFNQKKYLWDLKNHPQYTSILLDNWQIDNQHITIIAGPCSIENEQQLQQIASKIKPLGCNILRAGAYKPRTSPYDFQGLEEKGLQLLFEIKKKYHLPVVSEITSIEHLDLFVQYVDIIQVGARNMQNFELLKALGKINKPILLKRGMGNTIEELLLSAEYILSGGNQQVILCERGIRTFEKSTRTTLDLSAIPVLKKLTHLPVFVDPSHSVGKREYVEAMALAAIAAGADGIMVEVHDQPLFAKSDGLQALTIDDFKQLMQKCKKVAEAIGKK